MGMIDAFLQLSINRQIQFGIISVVFCSISIFLCLVIISVILQFCSVYFYFENIIQNDENDTIENVEKLTEAIETAIEVSAKAESLFLRQLEENYHRTDIYFNNGSTLIDNFDIGDNKFKTFEDCEKEQFCYFTLDSNNEIDEKEKKYLNMIYPIVKIIINLKTMTDETQTTFKNYQIYKPNYVIIFSSSIDKAQIGSYSKEKVTALKNKIIEDSYYQFMYLIPKLNSFYTKEDITQNYYSIVKDNPFLIDFFDSNYEDYSITKYQENFIPLSIVNLLFDNEIKLSSEGNSSEHISNLQKEATTFTLFELTDNVFGNVLSLLLLLVENSYIILSSNKLNLTEFNGENIEDKVYGNYIITPELCNHMLKFAFLNVTDTFTTKTNNIRTISQCVASTSENFKQYEPFLNISIFNKTSIEFSITNYNYLKDKENNIKTIKKLNTINFKFLKTYYPKSSTNKLDTISLNFLSNFFFTNYIFYNTHYSTVDSSTLFYECLSFTFSILYINFILWFAIFFYIVFTVMFISHSISHPIDLLILSVSMSGKDKEEKSGKDLHSNLMQISYKDDDTINEFFILCKKLILGLFKQDSNNNNKKNRINSYNNISLIKSNNMIINEQEILKGTKNNEINYFEANYKSNSNNDDVSSRNRVVGGKKVKFKNISFNVLSKPLFSDKFYNTNKEYLAKDNEYYHILLSELGNKAKKI